MSSSDNTTTNTSNAENNESMCLRTMWVKTMDELLDMIHVAYSDEPGDKSYDEHIGSNIATQRNNFKLLVLNSPEIQEQAIRKWHDVMNPYYKLFRDRNDEAILKSHCWVLEQINFKHIWNDEGLDNESREVLWDYTNKLNSFAETYCTVPESIMKMSERMAPSLENNNSQDIFGSVMENFGSIKSDDIGKLMENLPNLLKLLPNVMGDMKNDTNPFHAMLSSAASFSRKTDSDGSETDTFNIEQIMNAFTGMNIEGHNNEHHSSDDHDNGEKCDE